VALPLLLVKENRRRQAWAILIPLVAIVLIYGMLAGTASRASAVEMVRCLVVTLVTAWAVVWLLAHRLSTRSWILTCLLAFLVMLATGLLSYVCNFGLSDYENLTGLGVYFSVAALALVLPMAISGRCCRRVYAPGRFMAWLLLWMALVLCLGMVVVLGGVALFFEQRSWAGMMHLLVAVPFVALMGGIWGIAFYVLNLPFMLLAFRSSFYRERFCHVLGLANAPLPTAEPAAEDETGLGEPVGLS
jgi:hypothetical protein